MKSFFNLRTVKARLLALMAVVVLPIALLSVAIASSNLKIVTQEIEASQLQTVTGFTVRARIVLRGSLRLLMGAVASMNVLETTNANCDEVARKTLEAITKHPSLWIRLESGKICRSYIDDGFSDDIMSEIAAEQAGKSFVQPLAGADLALTRYDSIRINGHLYIAIYVKNHNDSLSKWEGILLIEPTLMQSAFELGSVIDGTIVAVMHSGNEALVTRFNEIIDTLWLPKTEVIHKDVAQWLGASKNGSNYVYASQMIAEPNLYTLVRFSSQASNAAWVQFLIMSLTPLLILALLTYFYARKIQSTVIRWITSIEIAAKNENLHSGNQKLVAIDEAMPSDIKSVAVAFNRMVLDTVERENALRESLQTNAGLMKELHHRIKNSLQVIQSYIALARRKAGGSQSPHLADAELKIQVLSVAYRFALTETGIRPVYIKSFIEEIVATLALSAQKNNQWVSNSIQSDTQLSVDRIIPLGLVIVEAIGAGLDAEAAKNVSVKIIMLDDLQVELVIKTDGILHHDPMDMKIINGLSLQLEATIDKPRTGEVLRWRFYSGSK